MRTTIHKSVDSFLFHSQVEELEDFWTLEEDEYSYDDPSFERLLESSYDF